MPWLAIIAAGIQGVSALDKAEKRKDAENELENMQVPSYTRNQSIIDYYDEALRKYKVSPTESAGYKLQKQNINQSVTQGLSALQGRRSGLAGIPALMSMKSNNLLKAAASAEADKSRQASIVGQAAGLAAQEKDREYQYNQIWPFQKKYNLLALKAANYAKAQNAREQGAFSSLGGAIGGMGGGGMGSMFGGG